jgi:hypothetical protein
MQGQDTGVVALNRERERTAARKTQTAKARAQAEKDAAAREAQMIDGLQGVLRAEMYARREARA